MPNESYFPQEFVPNIQAAPYHAKWESANKSGDAPKWRAFRDEALAYKPGDVLSSPTMATKYGKALVAAGKDHMSVVDLGSVWAPEPEPPPATEGPLTITAGGTITGRSFLSTTSQPAITIATASPVTIEDCYIENTSANVNAHLISQAGSAAQVTVSNCQLTGPPNGYARAMRFENFKSVVVENCTITRTGGIYFLQPGTAPSIIVRRNKIRNIQGDAGSNKRQFVQVNTVTTATQILIEWNEIINEFGLAVSEDVISVYQSNSCVIRNNYIQGGYPATLTGGHQGTGIILGDGGGSNNLAENNQIVGITNVGMGISGGNNNQALNNTIVSDGRTPTGQILTAANNGLVCYTSVWGTPTNAIMSGNKIGFMQENGGTLSRVDYWTPNASNNVETSNTFYYNNHSTPITKADEDAEWPIWLAKVAAAGITIGAT